MLTMRSLLNKPLPRIGGFIFNRLWFSLALLVGLSTLIGGCSETESQKENKSGIVWVVYGVIVPSEDRIPIHAVNEFLLQEGYTSQVIETWYRQNGQ